MQKPKDTKTFKIADKYLVYLLYIGVNFLFFFFLYLLFTHVIHRPLEGNDVINDVINDTIIKQDIIVDRSHIFEVEDFSEDRLKSYLLEVKVKFPEIVLAQAKLESANFKSELFVNHNNMFGMRIANSRPTLGENKGTGYASYYDWKSSVLDYTLYQSRYLKQYNTKDKYLERLGQVYAEDPNYVSKLRKLIN